MSSLNRTYHPKWATYWGDGNGRDQYITFNNGGLNEQRMYGSKGKNCWKDSVVPIIRSAAPNKEATAINYTGNGSGRDSYVIFNEGQKRKHNSPWKNFESRLRESSATPMMDFRQVNAASPGRKDLSMYNNWQSPKNRRQMNIVAKE
jgi:hypothetical protein